MKQRISDFEKSRTALERLLTRSTAQTTKTVAQLAKKKAKHSAAVKTAKPKKVTLVADIAKKSTPAKKKRLKKLNETIEVSSNEARELNVELKAARAELKELKASLAHYKAGFKAFDKSVAAHTKAVARKASKPKARRKKAAKK